MPSPCNSASMLLPAASLPALLMMATGAPRRAAAVRALAQLPPPWICIHLKTDAAGETSTPPEGVTLQHRPLLAPSSTGEYQHESNLAHQKPSGADLFVRGGEGVHEGQGVQTTGPQTQDRAVELSRAGLLHRGADYGVTRWPMAVCTPVVRLQMLCTPLPVRCRAGAGDAAHGRDMVRTGSHCMNHHARMLAREFLAVCQDLDVCRGKMELLSPPVFVMVLQKATDSQVLSWWSLGIKKIRDSKHTIPLRNYNGMMFGYSDQFATIFSLPIAHA